MAEPTLKASTAPQLPVFAALSPPPLGCKLDCRWARCVSIVAEIVINPIHQVHSSAFICITCYLSDSRHSTSTKLSVSAVHLK